MNPELKIKWNNLKEKLSKDFSDEQPIDLDSIIFLIGLQELGQFQKLGLAFYLDETQGF